ncbi:hypothetical protein N431DRAFT_22694 [Stipitochalara longipes BDJ]|nr:hypothetical protein N431DRAFT_22694 [Stipitochalara longipes BDJ]
MNVDPLWLLIMGLFIVLFALAYITTLCLSQLGMRSMPSSEDLPLVPYYVLFVENALALAFDSLEIPEVLLSLPSTLLIQKRRLTRCSKALGNILLRLALGTRKMYVISGTENLQNIFSIPRSFHEGLKLSPLYFPLMACHQQTQKSTRLKTLALILWTTRYSFFTKTRTSIKTSFRKHAGFLGSAAYASALKSLDLTQL